MKHLWLWMVKNDIRFEQTQAQQEGKDITALAAEFADLLADATPEDEKFQQRAMELFKAVGKAPMRKDYPYVEPSDLPGIRACLPEGARELAIKVDDTALADKIHGAWLGRCAGCLLGKPIEGWFSSEVWPMVRQAGHAMLTDYFWKLGVTPENLASHKPGAKPFQVYDHMPEDDDTNYTITGMAVVKEKGLSFAPEDVAEFWLREIPILHLCTAERVAYRNLVNQVPPPASAALANPYREWIGAQIRADFFGYVALGRPHLAAELAWRDASISHIKNGIYGEMWVAAMLAGAAVETDPERIIRIGLGEIPAGCRLAEAVEAVIGWFKDGVTYQQAVERIHQAWDERNFHDWCHTISNAQIVTIGLLWGQGDFGTAITRAVWPCFDTDCNGATVGSIMGMIHGAKALPEKWTGPLHDTLRTGVTGYSETTISGTAAEMFELYRKNRP